MRTDNRLLVLCSLGGLLTALSCTLITDVNRTKIPLDAGSTEGGQPGSGGTTGGTSGSGTGGSTMGGSSGSGTGGTNTQGGMGGEGGDAGLGGEGGDLVSSNN